MISEKVKQEEKSVKFRDIHDKDRSLEPLFSVSPHRSGSKGHYIEKVEPVEYVNIGADSVQYQNDSCEVKKQTLYQLNDHFSSFSTAHDFTKVNNLRLLNNTSQERNLKSSEGIDFTQQNYTINSNKFGSDYETMLKTANSFGSFNNSVQHNVNSSGNNGSSIIDKLKKNRIVNVQNTSAIEPIYNMNTIMLKKNQSYPMSSSRVSQVSIQNSNTISRESMKLTPQLQNPDVYVNSTKATDKFRQAQRRKVQVTVSRNKKNTLSQYNISSTEGSHTFISSFLSNSSQSNLLQRCPSKPAYPVHSFLTREPTQINLREKGTPSTQNKAKSKVSINAAYVTKVKKSKLFNGKQLIPNMVQSSRGIRKPGNISIKSQVSLYSPAPQREVILNKKKSVKSKTQAQKKSKLRR